MSSKSIVELVEKLEEIFRKTERNLERLINEFFETSLSIEPFYIERLWFIEPVIPVFEVREDENEVRIYVNLPGFSKGNVKLYYVPERKSLLIEGFREIEGEKKHVKYMIPITWNVEIEKAKAYMKEGVLVIRLPRKQPYKYEIKIE